MALNSIISWAKQVFIFSVLLTFITGLSASKKYEPYIKFVCGIIMTIVVLYPILNIVSDTSYIDNLNKEMNMSAEKIKLEDASKNYYADTFENEVEKNIENMSAELEIKTTLVSVTIDFKENSPSYGQVSTVNIIIYKKNRNEDLLKNKISDFYNIDKSNINISINGG